jgi:hypothetical protein
MVEDPSNTQQLFSTSYLNVLWWAETDSYDSWQRSLNCNGYKTSNAVTRICEEAVVACIELQSWNSHGETE